MRSRCGAGLLRGFAGPCPTGHICIFLSELPLTLGIKGPDQGWMYHSKLSAYRIHQKCRRYLTHGVYRWKDGSSGVGGALCNEAWGG